MTNRRLLMLAVLVAAVVGGVWWWRSHRSTATPATSTVTQPAGSGRATQTTRSPAPAELQARATVTVTDDKGPIAEAMVRFAPNEGEAIIVRTGADGIARVDNLAPGHWQISGSAPNHEPAALPDTKLTSGVDENLALTLALGGKPLTGVVTDAMGGPVAGARIEAAQLGAMARPGKAVATSLTAADGKYRLTVSGGHVLVAVSSADYAPQSRYVEVGAMGAIADFSLVPGGVIEGVVLDEKTRQPVLGARVDARRDRSRAVMLAEGGGQHAIAGADGRFRISGLSPGAYELGAHADSRDSQSPTIVGIGVAEQVSDVRLLVGIGPVIRGVVVDEGGALVPDARVSAISRGGVGSGATADAKGAFVLAALPPGSYDLTAGTELLVPAGAVSVELGDKDVDRITVQVRRGTKLVGHVEPRQICEVQFGLNGGGTGPGMMMMMPPVTTGADGEFSAGPTMPGTTEMTARCPSGDQGTLTIEVKDGMDLVIKVTPGASIAGRVIDGDGKPVMNATVMAALGGRTQRAVMVNGLVTSGVQALTSASGSYELRGLVPGSYRLSALDRGSLLRMRGKPVSVSPVERKTGVEIAVDRLTGVIKGSVTGPDGKPLADAWVSVHQDLASLVEGMMNHGAEGPSGGDGESRTMLMMSSDDEGGGGGASEVPPALTDPQGRFEISGLPHAKYDVVAEAQQGRLRGAARDVTPDATVALQVKGLTSLSGTVHGASGPAKLFQVELDGPTAAAPTFTDGKFELGRVDPGSYKVHVTSHDGNGEASVQIVADRPASIDIELAANAVVVGTIVDGTGKPLGGVQLGVFPDAGGPGVRISLEGPPPTSNPDGTFRLETKAGKSMLVVMVEPRPVTRRGLTLEAGKTFDVGAVRVVAGPPPKP